MILGWLQLAAHYADLTVAYSVRLPTAYADVGCTTQHQPALTPPALQRFPPHYGFLPGSLPFRRPPSPDEHLTATHLVNTTMPACTCAARYRTASNRVLFLLRSTVGSGCRAAVPRLVWTDLAFQQRVKRGCHSRWLDCWFGWFG